MISSKLVLASGVFDILHVGHVMYLEAAAKMGDWLVVAVTRDAHVNKGPNRPTFGQLERLRVVQALRCVNHAILVDSGLEALELVKPDIFVKGKDYIGKIQKVHQDFCAANKIEIRFTDTEKYSATEIIRDRARFG